MTVGARPRLRATVAEGAGAVCRDMSVDLEGLRAPRQDRVTVWARELVAVLAIERCGSRVSELASFVGKPADTVSSWVTRGLRHRVDDVDFAAHLEKLEAVLRGNTPDGGQSCQLCRSWYLSWYL